MSAAMNHFDTLEYSSALRKVGFTEEQANVQAKTLLMVVEGQFLTKRDLKATETQLSYEIKELESKTAIELELIRKIGRAHV